MLARPALVAALLALAAAAVPAQSPAPTVPQARPERTLSPRNASYTIKARLDPASRTIRGDEILTWRNTSSRAATTLQFHLYYNAWRNTRSTWMREREPRPRRSGARQPPGGGLGLD